MASNANQKTTVCSEGKFDGSVLFVPTTNGNSKIPAVGSPVVAGSIRPARQVYRTTQFEAEGIGYDYQSTALTLSGSLIGAAGDLIISSSQAVGVVQEGYVFNTTVVTAGSTGTGATVRVVDRNNFQLISGGHGYSVGDLLTIDGVTVTGPPTTVQVRVASVNNYNFVLKNSVQMPVRASVLVAANSMAAVPAGSYVKVSSMVNDVNYLTIARSDGTELNLGLESNPRARPNVYTYESGQGVVYELAFGPRLTSKLVSSSYNEIADPELVASLEGEHVTKEAAYLASITVNGITLTDAEKNVSVASANYAQQVGNLKLARSEFEKIAKKYSISTDVHQWSSYEQPPGSTAPVVGPTEAVIGSSIPITQNTGVSANFVASSYTVNVGTNNTYSGANGTGMAFTLVTRATNTDDVVSAAVVNPGLGYVDGEFITMTQADLRAITGIGTLTVTTPVVIQLTVENVSTQGNIPSTIGVIIWRARQSVGRETRNVKNAIASVKDAEETLRMVSKGINPSNAAAAKNMLDGVLEELDKARNTFVQKERKTLVTEHEPYLEFNVNRANVLNPFVASVVREVGGTRIYLRAYDSADPNLASQSHPVNMGGATQFQFDDSNVGFQQGPSGNGAGDYAKILSLSTRAISPRLSSVSEVYDVSVTPLPSIVVYSYGDTIIAADQSGKFLRRTTPAAPAWSEAMVGGQIYLDYNGAATNVVRTITGFTTVDGNPVFVLNTAIAGGADIVGYTIRFSNIAPTSGLKDAESGSVPVPVDFDVPNFTLTDRVSAAGADPTRDGIVIAGYPPDLTDTGRLVTDIVQLSCVIEDGEVDTEQYLKNPDGSIQLDNTGQPVPNPTYQQVLGLAVCKYRTVPWFREGMYMRSVQPIAGAFPGGAQSFTLGFGDDLIIPRFGPAVQTSTENFFGPAYVYLQRLGAFTSTSLDTNQLQTLPNGRALANTVSTGGISVVNGLWNLYPNANVYSNYHYFDFGPDTAENANQLKNAIFGTNKSDNEPKSTVLTLVPKTKGGLTINRRAPDQKPLSANQEAGATGCMGSVRGVTHIAIGNSSGKLTIHEGLASNSTLGQINGTTVDIVPLPNIINALAPPNICHPKFDEPNPPPPTPKCDFIPPPQQVSQSNYVVFRNAMRGTAAASSPLNVNNNDFAYILGNTSATGSAESSNQRGQLWRNPAGGSAPNSSAPLQTPVMYGGNRSKNGPFFETSITADFGANRQMAQSQIYPPVCSINLELQDGGTGYTVTAPGDPPLATTGGAGSGLTIYITSVTGNTGVYSFTIGNCGDGRYQVNDIITVTGGGGGDCELIVTAVNLSPANSTAATSGVNAQVLAEWTPPVIPRETGTMTFTVISQATAAR